MIHFVLPEDFLTLGLSITGWDETKQQRVNEKNKMLQFKSFFASSPESLTELYLDLQTTNIINARMADVKPFYLLLTICWLSRYYSERELCGIFNGIGVTTAREKIWRYTESIAALRPQKVRWNIMR